MITATNVLRTTITKLFLLVNRAFLIIETLERYGKKADYNAKYGIPMSFIVGRKVHIYGRGMLTVGRESNIGNYSAIQVSEGYRVTIGDSVAISHNVRIYTCGRNAKSIICDGRKKFDHGDVRIGNNVWIGANAMILHNVEIASGVIVGANSVVTKSILEPGVYGGCPARKLKSYK